MAVLLVSAAASPAAAQIVADGQRFHPVLAPDGMVVSREARASAVGRDVLRAGGNAIDAAVAVGFALAVTLPRAGNLGGGGFMMVHMAEEDETVAIDYRETAPAAATRDMFLDAAGDADPAKSRFSGLAVGVPGTVAGLARAHALYGSGRFTLAELIRPAVALARDGIAVTRPLHDGLASDWVRPRLSADPAAAAVFYPDGRPLAVGALLRQPDLADTLEAIAREGPDGFYRGAVAGAIAETVRERGGVMTRADLAAYAPIVREPVRGRFMGYEIVSMPPPSSGGVHLVQMLNILSRFPLAEWGHGSARTIHAIAEAARRAYADRARYLGDPDFVDVPLSALIDSDYAARLAEAIDPRRATASSAVAPGLDIPAESAETTHFSVVDADGNAVANTYTLNFSYGVGFMATGTGVLLNNELDDFSAKPGVPNAYGLVGGEANAVAPGKRPLSSMTPTIILREGDVFLVTGSPGGSRIITTVLQVVLNVLAHGLDLATATAAPRIHHQWLPDELRVEQGISPDTLAILREMGHAVTRGRAIGSAQSIAVGPDGMRAGVSDPRRPGGAALGH